MNQPYSSALLENAVNEFAKLRVSEEKLLCG